LEASIVDLRYHMNNVLKALRRNEKVNILYRGKIMGVLSPIKKQQKLSVKTHPFCGMHAKDKTSVNDIIKKLRKFRYESI